jgi:NAD-dependent deacetylase
MKIIAFTGAGISKDSGIDTFQDRPGIRDKLTRSYALKHPDDYKKVMQEFKNNIEGKEPNDAHIALAEYKIPIITMNVDTLHEQAGSTDIIKVHGRLPRDDEMETPHLLKETPVLYEDAAPKYSQAMAKVSELGPEDVFLVIGASTYTGISVQLREIAQYYGATVIEIQQDAKTEVRKEIKRCLQMGGIN